MNRTNTNREIMLKQREGLSVETLCALYGRTEKQINDLIYRNRNKSFSNHYFDVDEMECWICPVVDFENEYDYEIVNGIKKRIWKQQTL
jgi:hypothetical protein